MKGHHHSSSDICLRRLLKVVEYEGNFALLEEIRKYIPVFVLDPTNHQFQSPLAFIVKLFADSNNVLV